MSATPTQGTPTETAGSLGLCGPPTGPVAPGPVRVLHPAVAEKTRWFDYEHLPPDLREVSKPFAELMHRLVELPIAGPQLALALQKLIEAKDCAVRAAITGRDDEP